MSNIDFSGKTLEETWKIIPSHLQKNNIEAVLVGGGVATIYSQGKYMSGDIDFVMGWGNTHSQIKTPLESIGFTREGTIYRHPSTTFSLDFSNPPVDIGDNNDPEIVEQEFNGQSIKILSPSECIKDRLNKFTHWNDESAMQAAVAVAKSVPYSITKVEQFCKVNKMETAFSEFKRWMNL